MKVRIWDWKSMERVPMRTTIKYKHHRKYSPGDPSGAIVLYRGKITRNGVRALSLQDVEM